MGLSNEGKNVSELTFLNCSLESDHDYVYLDRHGNLLKELPNGRSPLPGHPFDLATFPWETTVHMYVCHKSLRLARNHAVVAACVVGLPV